MSCVRASRSGICSCAGVSATLRQYEHEPRSLRRLQEWGPQHLGDVQANGVLVAVSSVNNLIEYVEFERAKTSPNHWWSQSERNLWKSSRGLGVRATGLKW
jgi:hypothetical protein